MLLQKELSGKNKIDIAVERIQVFAPEGGYYLAFSGGKDSVVIKKLSQMAGILFDAHYSSTTIDPPEVVSFIKNAHGDVIFNKPKKSFLKILESRGFPIRCGRWCCEELKENYGSGRHVMTGVRWGESTRRANTRRLIETCYRDKTKTYVNPIIDWTNHDVWEFIRMFNLPYCNLYDRGFDRVGCLFCPMVSAKKRIRETQLYPKFTALFIKAFNRLYDLRKTQGRVSVERWSNGEEMFWWWIKGG